MIHVIFAGVTVLFALGAWVFWWAWREEKALSEAVLLFNLARNVQAGADLRETLPGLARVAAAELPAVRRVLLADVARKYRRTPEALEAALLADTGSSSLEEALQARMGSSSVEDTLLALLTDTRDPFRLLARRLVRKSREERWLRSVESLLLPMAIVLTLVAVALLALSVRGGAVAGGLSAVGRLRR